MIEVNLKFILSYLIIYEIVIVWCHSLLLGNIILTDYEHVILAVLRPRHNDENNKVIVRETYPVSNEIQQAQEVSSISIEKLNEIVEKASPTDNMKKMFVPHCSVGPALLGKTNFFAKNNA